MTAVANLALVSDQTAVEAPLYFTGVNNMHGTAMEREEAISALFADAMHGAATNVSREFHRMIYVGHQARLHVRDAIERDDSSLMIAWRGQTPIGLAIAVPAEDGVHDIEIGVRPEERRNGIARRLYSEINRDVRSRGGHTLRGMTFNPAAEGFVQAVTGHEAAKESRSDIEVRGLGWYGASSERFTVGRISTAVTPR